MSTRRRHAPWFRRKITMRDLRLAASIQFDIECGEEPLTTMLMRARLQFAFDQATRFMDDHSVGWIRGEPIGYADIKAQLDEFIGSKS